MQASAEPQFDQEVSSFQPAAESAQMIVGVSSSHWQQLMGAPLVEWHHQHAAARDITVLVEWWHAFANKSDWSMPVQAALSAELRDLMEQSSYIVTGTSAVLQQTRQQLLRESAGMIYVQLHKKIRLAERNMQQLQQRICLEQPALMLLEQQGLHVDVVRIVAQYISDDFAQPSAYRSVFSAV